jgi:hypothetical protein
MYKWFSGSRFQGLRKKKEIICFPQLSLSRLKRRRFGASTSAIVAIPGRSIRQTARGRTNLIREGLGVLQPLVELWIVAAAYSGWIVSSGLSSSIALAQGNPGSALNIVQKMPGTLLTLNETVIAPFNIVPVLFIGGSHSDFALCDPTGGSGGALAADSAWLIAEDQARAGKADENPTLARHLKRAWVLNLRIIIAGSAALDTSLIALSTNANTIGFHQFFGPCSLAGAQAMENRRLTILLEESRTVSARPSFRVDLMNLDLFAQLFEIDEVSRDEPFRVKS